MYARAVVTRCELRVNKGRAVSHHHAGFTQRASCVASARLKRELYFLDAAFGPFTLRSSTQEGLGTPYQPENLCYLYDDTSRIAVKKTQDALALSSHNESLAINVVEMLVAAH